MDISKSKKFRHHWIRRIATRTKKNGWWLPNGDVMRDAARWRQRLIDDGDILPSGKLPELTLEERQAWAAEYAVEEALRSLK